LSGRLLHLLISIVLPLSCTIAIRASQKIIAAEIKLKARILSEHPLIGRAIEGRPEYRELVLEVLNARYVFRYGFDGERLAILRVFHSREARE
jgi:hypothetical protein